MIAQGVVMDESNFIIFPHGAGCNTRFQFHTIFNTALSFIKAKYTLPISCKNHTGKIFTIMIGIIGTNDGTNRKGKI